MRILKAAVVLLIASFIVHAGFTQWYETGYSRVVSPILALTIAGIFVAFIQRKPWSWSWATSAVIGLISINVLFWPQRVHFGAHLRFAHVLIAVEVVLLAIVGGFMLHPATKQWFREPNAD